jgi:GT2 family glycosyltransferase
MFPPARYGPETPPGRCAAPRADAGGCSDRAVAGELDRLWRCLESLAAQPEAPDFGLVLADMGAPGLERVAAQLGGDVTWLRTPERRSCADAVNAAVQAVTSETVVLLGDAPVCAHGLLEKLVSSLQRGDTVAAAAGGDGVCDAIESLAVAARRSDVLAVGGVPDVAADRMLSGLLLRLARVGEIAFPAGPSASALAPSPAPPRHGLDAGPELSIVIPTLEASGTRVRACLRAIAATTPEPHEVVVVDNGSSPQGYTRPVNSGLRAATGTSVVVMNDDVEPLPGWWPPLRAALAAGAPVVFPRTVEGAMRHDFAAWCFALSRQTLERFETAPGAFLDPQFTVWFQDTDLLVRLRAAGTPPVEVPESTVRHALSQTVNTTDPALAAWIREQIAIDQQRFTRKHR